MTLQKLKGDISDFANNLTEAAKRYAATDQHLGGRLGQPDLGRNGSSGQPGGGTTPAAGGGLGQMGGMMQMPMQMAGQALQAPMQAVGMLGALPQTLMQGMQSLGGMAGGNGSGKPGDLAAEQAQPDWDNDKDKQDKADRPAEPPHQAAGPQRERLQPTPDVLGDGAAEGSSKGPAAPVIPPAPARPAAPGTEINL